MRQCLEITYILFILFGNLHDLDNFLTLKNANKFAFSSLNRNFALILQAGYYQEYSRKNERY